MGDQRRGQQRLGTYYLERLILPESDPLRMAESFALDVGRWVTTLTLKGTGVGPAVIR